MRIGKEMAEVNIPKNSVALEVRRPDYPDMFADGTTASRYIGPNETRCIGATKGSPLLEKCLKVLEEELQLRFSLLVGAVAKQVGWEPSFLFT
jgi:hypothetical protein